MRRRTRLSANVRRAESCGFMEDSLMAIGFQEPMVLMLLFAVPCIALGGVIWLVSRRSSGSLSPGRQRPIADRLAELESLRRAGQISADEYAKQRSSIISCI